MRFGHGNGTRSGFTLVELLVTVVIIALLIALILPAFGPGRSGCGKQAKDRSQLKQIHQACIVFADENKGRLPTPGLIDRLTDPYVGDVPGVGPEDHSRNHTAAIYSTLIGMNYFSPEIAVGPTEVNPIVRVATYDYSKYAPEQDSYWDPAFAVDLETGPACNTSYAHLAVCGHRKDDHWLDTQSAAMPMFATRGTRDGASTGDEYDRSPTLLLHGSKHEWVGNVVFADNHVEHVHGFFPPLTSFDPPGAQVTAKDNIFAAEWGVAAADVYLIIGLAAGHGEHTCTPVYDTLD